MPSFILFYIFVVFSPRGVCSENASERKMEGGAQEANVVATAEGLRQRLVEAVSGGPTLPYHILLPYLMVKLGTACSTVPCTCSTGSTEGWPKVAKSARKNRSQKKVSRGDKIRGWIASIPLPETSPPPRKKKGFSYIYGGGVFIRPAQNPNFHKNSKFAANLMYQVCYFENHGEPGTGITHP